MNIEELRLSALNNTVGLKRRYSEDGTYDYIGFAPAGAGTDEPKWRIARVKQSNGDTDHANGSADFVHKWDDATSYDFS